MSGRGAETDLVTGAFSYSGSRIAELLIESGREVRTLTHHPDREHPLRARVQAQPYRFDDPVALKRSLEGISTLYNTYWVRFERSGTITPRLWPIPGRCLRRLGGPGSRGLFT